MQARWVLVIAAVVSLACQEQGAPNEDGDGASSGRDPVVVDDDDDGESPGDPAPGSDGTLAEVPADELDVDVGSPPPDDDGGGNDGGNGGTVDPAAPSVRFVALGDSGKGNDGQYAVAAAMKAVCDERGGCDFGVMLGDNIYQTGVDDVDDAQWQEKFELPYAELDFRFYVTLGNHDYGSPEPFSFLGGIGIDPRRGEHQVDYTEHSEKFVMLDTHYRVVEGPVELVSLNTTSLFWADSSTIAGLTGFDDENDRLVQSVTTWNAESTSPWRVAFAHHPYRSNGPHGNAGEYDNVFIEGLVGSGSAIKVFLEDYVLGEFDVFLCGHDHSLQDMGEAEGTELFVSGGGASHTELEGDNVAVWQKDRMGFMLIEADESAMTFTFVVVPDPEDSASAPWSYDHTRTITH